MGLTAAGGIMSAGSSIMQGLAADNYYRQMAASAQSQARLGAIAAEQENEYTAREAAYETQRLNADNAKIMAAQRAAFAANGLTGSVMAEDLIAGSIDAWAKDKEAIRYSAAAKQFETTKAAKINAINLNSQAAQYRIAGSNAKTSGLIGAAGGLLGTAGQVAGQWYQYKNDYAANNSLTTKEKAVFDDFKNSPYYKGWSVF
jgi:hypothetical protein